MFSPEAFDLDLSHWQNNIQWKKSIAEIAYANVGLLPSNCGDQLIIVGYHDEVLQYNVPCMILFADIIASVDRSTVGTPKWSELAPPYPYWPITLYSLSRPLP